MKTAIYARLSKNPDGISTSVERQVAACRKRFEPSWEEVGLYEDDDISAYSGKARPQFERLLKDIQAKNVDIVVAYALDRLGRRPKDIERLLESGVRFVTVRDALDSKTASAELFIRVLAAVAKMESDNTSARIRLKHEELRERGAWQGGKKPFGWLPSEAEAFRKAAEALIAGESLQRIAASLGLAPVTVRRAFMSSRMIGKRDPSGPVGMPVILSEDTWRSVQRVLTDPARRTTLATTKRSALLSGLLHCSCGAKMYVNRRQGNSRYVCSKALGGCGKRTIAVGPVEELVRQRARDHMWTRLRSLEKSTAKAKEERERERAQVAKELQDLRHRLYPLIDMYAKGELTLAEWQVARGTLDRQIEDLERQLELKNDGSPGTMEVPLKGADEKPWLNSLIEKIIVSPSKTRGRTFDEGRVEILWR